MIVSMQQPLPKPDKSALPILSKTELQTFQKPPLIISKASTELGLEFARL
jgi:hypothetical protein